MLDRLTLADVTPLVGTKVTISREKEPPLELTVEKATALSYGSSPDRRAPFSLWFKGPAEPLLPQRMYPFDLGPLGKQTIFIVPIGRTADGIRYEAIFN